VGWGGRVHLEPQPCRREFLAELVRGQDKQSWAAPALPATVERRREPADTTKAVSRSRIDRLCRRRDVPLREKTLWRMLYESASRTSAVLALNVEDLHLPNKQAKITAKGGDTMWITWGTDTAHLLPRLISGRESGPLFLAEHRPGAHRKATIDPRDLCPETGRTRLGYDRARILLGHHSDGRLHQLRHSASTHLGEAGVDATVIMAKTGHKSLRTLQRYVRPGLTAVHQATESLPSPRLTPCTALPCTWSFIRDQQVGREFSVVDGSSGGNPGSQDLGLPKLRPGARVDSAGPCPARVSRGG
jgi:integrase